MDAQAQEQKTWREFVDEKYSLHRCKDLDDNHQIRTTYRLRRWKGIPPLWATAIREQVCLKLNDPFTSVRTLSKYIHSVAVSQN